MTLIELLVVIAIISLLAALLSPALVGAHRHAENTAYQLTLRQEVEATQERLQSFFSTHATSHPWTVEELSRNGVFDAYVRDWMAAGRIHYIPFTTNDPDNKVVMKFWEDDKVYDGHGNLMANGEVDLALVKKNIIY